MKVAIVGCGALGSYYGAKLARDGHEVHFLLRSDYEVVRRRGVRILSPEGDFHVNPKCARQPEDIGASEVVFIGLKTTANDQFPRLLPPLVDKRTAVVTLQNGLGNEEDLAQIFPREQILGGLCFVCLNRLEPGVIRHTAHGKIVLGEFSGWPEPRTHDIASAIRHSGVTCSVTDNLSRAHWQKLVWNIPFNGLGVAAAAGFDAFQSGHLPTNAGVGRCLPTDELLADPRWGPLVRELMLEVIAAANALGFSISETYADHQIDRTRLMGAYFASTLVDFERGQPLELKALFQEPLRQAQALGVAMPRLERLHRILERLDSARERLSSPEAER